jgi:putative transposase
MRVYKFRLYPTKSQEQMLFWQLNSCRFVYNQLLEELGRKKERSHIQHYILELKTKFPELKQVHSKVLQYECYRLFSNMKGLALAKKKGNKIGKLRFKGKDWFKTMVYNQSGFKLIVQEKRFNILHLSKIGDIRILQHRDVEGNIKGVIIKRKVDTWEAHIITDGMYRIKRGENIIGIDLGIVSFLTDNNGNKIDSPLFFKRALEKLEVMQQELSRKKRGSHNRYKTKKRIAKLHEHVEQQRNDFLHKTTTKLVGACKFIGVEDLNIESMKTTTYNARNISDSAWGKFLSMLGFKAESAGCRVIKVDPANTSKECSACGNKQDMPLWKRQYECPQCGMSLERDTNSAIIILRRALEQGTAETSNCLLMTQEAPTSTSQC